MSVQEIELKACDFQLYIYSLLMYILSSVFKHLNIYFFILEKLLIIVDADRLKVRNYQQDKYSSFSLSYNIIFCIVFSVLFSMNQIPDPMNIEWEITEVWNHNLDISNFSCHTVFYNFRMNTLSSFEHIAK